MQSRDQKAIAILCSDFHASLNPPALRSREHDWFHTMAGVWHQVENIQLDNDQCPIIFAGDLFHSWDAPAELINFMMNVLPANMYCIPGQHDLPEHNYGQIRRSAYWTLVKAGRIKSMNFSNCWEVPSSPFAGIAIAGFPYGNEIVPYGKKHRDTIWDCKTKIAVIHQYSWVPDYHPEGMVPPTPSVSNFQKSKYFKGYDVVVSGDNHHPFDIIREGKHFVNCGCMMRRSTPELKYEPSVKLLFRDSNHKLIVKKAFLNTKNDTYHVEEEIKTPLTPTDWNKVIDDLKHLGKTSLDFADLLTQKAESFCSEVQALISRSLKEGEHE